jgi:hypothetical protein
MAGKNFFELDGLGDTFTMTVTTANVLGFMRGDVLTCHKTSKPIPGKVAILESDACERWSMLSDEAGPELAACARLIGQALCLCRSLDRGRHN